MAERVFVLPDLGEGLEDAEVVEWRVREGQAVKLNEVLVEVNTAKALVEIPSPFEGVVTRLHARPGDVVKVGEPLVTIESPEQEEPGEVLVGYGPGRERAPSRRVRLRPPGEGRPEPLGSGAEARPGPAAPAGPGARSVPATSARPGPPSLPAPPGRPQASTVPTALPPVRRLARELGVDLRAVPGTGPGGRITREDVLRAAGRAVGERGVGAPGGPAPAEQPPVAEEAGRPEGVAPPVQDRRVPVRGVRRTIAHRMAQAWDEVPHAAGYLEVDATALEAFRAWIGRSRPEARVSPLAIVVRALAEVCRQHPAINAWYDHEAEEIVFKGACHVGVATATDRGLLVPVVRDVGSKGLLTVAREMSEVVEAARQGRAGPEQLTGSTITVTNVGSLGLDFGWPVVNFPEVAILGVGAIRERAVVVGGRVVARPSFFVSMTIDHRALDGADSARALVTLREILEDEERLRALLLG